MRAERVATNLTCNQGCTYCNSRSPVDDRAFIEARAVRSRIDDAAARGAKEIILSGGEPTLRRDLVELIAHARTLADAVVLETNATVIDTTRANALKAAGLSLARVNAVGLIAPMDRVTRDPEGAARTLAGIRALLAAGVPTELDVALVTSTIVGVVNLPAQLKEWLGDLRAIKAMQIRVPVDSPNASELITYDAAAEVIARLETQARRHELRLRLSPDSSPPPCVFDHQSRVAHLYSLTAGGSPRSDHSHVEACASCQLADRCDGLPNVYLARHRPPRMKPVEEDMLRRRLSLAVSTEEQVRREFVTTTRREGANGVEIEKIIRVNFHCNQSCRFCFVSTHLPSQPDGIVREAIAEAAAEGSAIVLSGGEPTLNPNLIEYVTLARKATKRQITLQTNATRINAEYARKLAQAGVDLAFVSLHAATAEISDAITESPGTFDKTLIGLDALTAAEIQVILNFVVCRKNAGQLLAYTHLVAARWPTALMNISFVAPSNDVVPKEAALIPRYSDVLPEIALAVAEAQRLGVWVVGFESMCGLPLCLVPTELSRYLDFTSIPEDFSGDEFVKPDPCSLCDLRDKCFGLRRGYRDLYGDSELSPYRSTDSASRSTDSASRDAAPD